MTRLERLPERTIIMGFKGRIDFYYWKGIPVARKWPNTPPPIPSPAMAAEQQMFAAVTKSWADLDSLFKNAASAMVASTQQRNFDLYQSAQWGHQFTDSPGLVIAQTESQTMLTVPINYTGQTSGQTIPVNSASYVSSSALRFLIPFDLLSFTNYRLVVHGQANQAGQTLDILIREFVTQIPLGTGTPDLSLTNTLTEWDSGDNVIVQFPPAPTIYELALKGSNGTVDMLYLWATLYLWQVP